MIILHLNGFDDVNETRNKHKYLCMANKLLILYLYADVWLNLLNIIILNQLILSATDVNQYLEASIYFKVIDLVRYRY